MTPERSAAFNALSHCDCDMPECNASCETRTRTANKPDTYTDPIANAKDIADTLLSVQYECQRLQAENAKLREALYNKDTRIS